jgi:hypothetical protein
MPKNIPIFRYAIEGASGSGHIWLGYGMGGGIETYTWITDTHSRSAEYTHPDLDPNEAWSLLADYGKERVIEAGGINEVFVPFGRFVAESLLDVSFNDESVQKLDAVIISQSQRAQELFSESLNTGNTSLMREVTEIIEVIDSCRNILYVYDNLEEYLDQKIAPDGWLGVN